MRRNSDTGEAGRVRPRLARWSKLLGIVAVSSGAKKSAMGREPTVA